MVIKVKVISRAKRKEIVQIAPNSYKIRVKAVPEKNKANKELIQALAEYFKVSQGQIIIVQGKNLRQKTIQIN